MAKDSSATNNFDPIARGVAQSGVRIANERAVLTLVALVPGLSNADLARRSGLGPQTTSRIVSDLEERGLIKRGEVLRGRRGQPATPLFIDPEGAYAIGVEIGWRHCKVVLIDIAARLLASIHRAYDYPDAQTIFGDIAADIATLTSSMTPQQRSRLVAIGVASPTAIDRGMDRVGAPAEQRELWKGTDVRAALARATGMNTVWFNDGNAACWGEIVAHPAPRPAGFAYFQVSTFIGAGIVSGQGLWEGPTGNAADLGAIVVPGDDGKPAFVHFVASIAAFESRLIEAGLVVPPDSPVTWDWAALEPHVTDWLDSAGRALAAAVVSTQAMIELDKTIIDGVMPRPIVERLLERIQVHLDALPTLTVGKPTIAIGHLGAAAAAMGAAHLPLYQRFFSPAWTHFTD
ncbi:hypothetical protein VW29_04700 [Devosia limi DSM 17137]|uniref:Sugar kinase of the NBD/HSP70 family, may contain an N-terminal HTH domain n=1 Tax=Devosia limi DSM 17137 TaxID=1121477 RepID=A0A0F5LV46_9HYPH|nr:ROK family transcriptional regulator [Devosia limi]KKB86034.1 hypothetical protein VW29_04700 [Devosia limi DSM 17137]SHG00986.1 Sugar kinase of the NBD/HSP70 family, may contain an N-terminal HTH domain [Devosia limi DSM 17137]